MCALHPAQRSFGQRMLKEPLLLQELVHQLPLGRAELLPG
jgi:hypothetical protein